MRIDIAEIPVLEGARFGFIEVDDQIKRSRMVFGQEAPLDAGRETGPAAPPQAAVLDHRQQRLARRGKNLLETAVAALFLIDLQVLDIGHFS